MFPSRHFLTVSALLQIVVCGNSTWMPLANITLAPRQEHTVVFLPPDTIAILGGVFPNSSTTDLVQFYSLRKNTWRAVAPLPVALNHPNAAVVDGKLFVFGGLADTVEEWSAIPDSWVYDEEKNEWKSVAPLPSPRGSAAVGVFNGTVVLAGGLERIQRVTPYAQDTVDTVSVYDVSQDSWLSVPETAARMPDTRDHAGGAVVGERLYVLGGRQQGQLAGKDTVLTLDLGSLNAGWTVSGAKMPTVRAGLSVGSIGHNIFTFGGEGNLKVTDTYVFNNTEVYDTKTDSWRVLASMAFPRHGTGAVSVAGRIYIPGGGDVIGVSPVSYFDVFVP